MPSTATFDDGHIESADDVVTFVRLDASSLMSLSQPPDEVVEKVRIALNQFGRFASRPIDVSLEDGRIVLRGTVRTWFQKQLAQHIVMQAPGLPPVVNALVVDPNRPIASVN